MYPDKRKKSKRKDETTENKENEETDKHGIHIVNLSLRQRCSKVEDKPHYKTKTSYEIGIPTVVIDNESNDNCNAMSPPLLPPITKFLRTPPRQHSGSSGISRMSDLTLPSISHNQYPTSNTNACDSASSGGTFQSRKSSTSELLSPDWKQAGTSSKSINRYRYKLGKDSSRNKPLSPIKVNDAGDIFSKKVFAHPGGFKGHKLTSSCMIIQNRYNDTYSRRKQERGKKYITDIRTYKDINTAKKSSPGPMFFPKSLTIKRVNEQRLHLSKERKSERNIDIGHIYERPRTQSQSPGHRFKKPNAKSERVISMESLVAVAQSVGVISCNNDYWGTGFVVGDRYVLTAFHVVQAMLGLQDDNNIHAKLECRLREKSCCIIFNFRQDVTPNYQNFHFKSEINYCDIQLDVIILEMVENFGIEFPPSISSFGDLQSSDVIHFIGHPGGKPKQMDIQCYPFSINENEANDLRESLRNALGDDVYNDLSNDYPDPYQGIEDGKKYFFNCTFEHTASGSPGMVVDNDGNARICTMLLGGYPTFNWDIDDETRARINPKLRFEFGVKISELYASLKEANEKLCWKVFQKCPWSSLSYQVKRSFYQRN